MRPSVRLLLSAVVIFVSAVYALLVKEAPTVASAVATGYVAALLTALFLANVWKKP